MDLTRYQEQHQFSFDHAFDESANNRYVYQCTTAPIVRFVMQVAATAAIGPRRSRCIKPRATIAAMEET